MIVSYLLLFGSAFLAATIFPFYSEVLLFALLRDGGDPLALVVVATAGTTLTMEFQKKGFRPVASTPICAVDQALAQGATVH